MRNQPKDKKAQENRAKLGQAPRRGLSRVEAALYVGISPTKFDELVSDGRMPPPKRIDTRKIWDVRALDVAFDALPGGSNEYNKSNDDPWGHVSAEVPSSRHQARKVGRRPRSVVEVPDDPEVLQLIDRMAEQGITRRYLPGEWENEVCSFPMGKREVAALWEFYRVRNEPLHYVKGSGIDTRQRLSARGYIALAQERDDRESYYRITPEGETAWLAIKDAN